MTDTGGAKDNPPVGGPPGNSRGCAHAPKDRGQTGKSQDAAGSGVLAFLFLEDWMKKKLLSLASFMIHRGC